MYGTKYGILPSPNRPHPMTAPHGDRSWRDVLSNRRLRAGIINLSSFGIGLLIFHLSGMLDLAFTPSAPPLYHPPSILAGVSPTTKDGYVLFYPTSEMDDWYLRSALIMIFALTTDPKFKDRQGRDVVVLTSNLTSDADVTELEAAGATVRPIPYFIDGLFPSVGETLARYKYTFNKIWVWDLEEYDRVLYMDTDMVLVRPLEDVWMDPHAWPESGLAATADIIANPDGSYFNSGFMMVRPNKAVFEELKTVELDDVFYPDQVSRAVTGPGGLAKRQNLLNSYYSRTGSKPWEPLNHLSVQRSKRARP